MAKAKSRAPAPPRSPGTDPLTGETLPAVVKPTELAEKLADPEFRGRIEEAIANLPPDKAAELVDMLEESMRRRKIELAGYIAAALVLLVGMVIAMYAFGRASHRQFAGWYLLLPLAASGVMMIAVSRWANKREKEARARRAEARAIRAAEAAEQARPKSPDKRDTRDV